MVQKTLLTVKEVVEAFKYWPRFKNKKTRPKVPVLYRGILGEVMDYNLVERYTNVMPTMRRELNEEIVEVFLKGKDPKDIPALLKYRIGEEMVSFLYVVNLIIGTKESPGFARFVRDEIRRRSGYCPFCEPISKGSPQAYTPKLTSDYCPRCHEAKLRQEIPKNG